MIDCVLMTPELVVAIEGKRTEPLSAATDWYPKRSQLVRNLEAGKQLATCLPLCRLCSRPTCGGAPRPKRPSAVGYDTSRCSGERSSAERSSCPSGSRRQADLHPTRHLSAPCLTGSPR
jgi:hypothetical protein